jgi:hypothetical protein
VVFTASINALNKTANDLKITLISLGCKSALAPGTGVATEFNTLEAVQRLVSAAAGNTWGEFATRLTDDGSAVDNAIFETQVALVLDAESLRHVAVEGDEEVSTLLSFDLMQRSEDAATTDSRIDREDSTLGIVTMSIRSTAPPTSPPPTGTQPTLPPAAQLHQSASEGSTGSANAAAVLVMLALMVVGGLVIVKVFFR